MENKTNISGAGYIIPPTTDHPFWEDGDIAENLTATATVDNTTGTPAVDVTKNGYNLNFAFTGLKGERGQQGEKGDPGEQGIPGKDGAPGKDGKSVTVTSTGSDVSGAVAGSVIDGNGNYITVYNGKQGAKGEQGEPGVKGDPGEQGAPGKDGSDADISKCVTNISVVNAGNTYTVKQTKGNGTTTGAGIIVVPNKMSSNPKTVDNAYTPINAEGTTLDDTQYMYLCIDDEFTFSEDGIQGLTLETNISTILPISNGQSRTVPVTITGYNSYNCSIFRAVCDLTVNNNAIIYMQYRFYLMEGNYTSLVGLTWNNRTKVVFRKVSTL